MTAVKVVYNYETRRFIISSTSTWSELEYQLRDLFKIPNTFRIITSYIDEDGDNITLSSDLELQEVISQYSKGIPIRLVLTTLPTDVEETTTAVEQMKIKDVEYDGARVHFAHPELETETERSAKDCEEKCTEFDYVSSTEEEVDQSSSDPEIYVIVHGSRRKPRFGYAKFDSPEDFGGFPSMRGDHHRGSSYRFRGAHGRPRPFPFPTSELPEGTPHGPESNSNFGPFNNPFGSPFGSGEFHGHGFGGFGGLRGREFSPFGPGGFRGHGSGPCDKHVKEPGPHGHGHCHKYNKRGHGRLHGYGRHGHGHGHSHCHGPPLTPEELAEKVELLNSMGFPPENNAHYEELLKKFCGRIGHVVEILLCERKHKDDKDKKPRDDGKDHEEGETSATMEAFEESDGVYMV